MPFKKLPKFFGPETLTLIGSALEQAWLSAPGTLRTKDSGTMLAKSEKSRR